MVQVDRTGVEVVHRKECLDLLATQVVGRIGIIVGSQPLVLPVNFALDGETIVIATAPGAKLYAARGRPACFEVDETDHEARSGWSVVLQGPLEEVTRSDTPLLERLDGLADPWLGEDRNHVVRLVPTTITGRRVRPRANPGTASGS
jgi:nitroimidazol reductase NimA-like FMN-containing flavoprotein (pyridoxamine 5'-phosphate oxidase superfamily)